MGEKNTKCPSCKLEIEYWTKKNFIHCSRCHNKITVEPCEDPLPEEPKLTKTDRLLALRDEIDALMADDD